MTQFIKPSEIKTASYNPKQRIEHLLDKLNSEVVAALLLVKE